MRALLMLCLATTGCLTTVTQMTVDRSLMAPLHDPPTAALVPSGLFAVHGSLSSLPSGTFGPLGGDPNTGVQVPMLQGDLGVLVKFDSGVLLGGEVRAATATLAAKATRAQISMDDGFMGGTTLRFGYAWASEGGFGVTVSVEPGLNWLPENDTLNGTHSITTVALGASIVPTYRIGSTRLFLGAMTALVPQMTRTIIVTCTNVNGCGSTDPDGSGDFAIGLTTGARYQLDPGRSVALSFTLTHEAVGWLPVFALSFAFDVARRPDAPEPEEPAPPVELREAPAPLAPSSFGPL